MAWTDEDTNLRDVLCGLYYTKDEVRRIAEQAGIKPARLNMDGKLVTVWWGVIREAKLLNKRDALIQVALDEYDENIVLQRLARGEKTDVKGPDISEDIQWHDTDDAETLEKIIGKQSTILPISFLETGLEKSKSVARIVLKNGESGSGFLIDNNLLLTNHHVLPNTDTAASAKVQFNVQKLASGLDAPTHEFDLDPDSIFETDKENDWTAVGIKGDANAAWGAISISNANLSKNDRVIIVQHPGGGPKAIALYHNIVTFVGDSRVQYLTDTLPGSSGSPVFDNQWNLVAIHHSGGWLREPNSKQALFRNEGISLSAISDSIERLLQT